MLELSYLIYLKLLARIGGILSCFSVHGADGKAENQTPLDFNEHVDRSLDHDALATRYGNRYRGMGVIVGLLGASIILCALMPLGTSLDHSARITVGVVEILLMLFMLMIVLYAKFAHTHSEWIFHRRNAERQRYVDIEIFLNSDKKDFRSVKTLLTKILNEQIKYNRDKSEFYERIEHFSNILAWIGFLVAFVCAAVHIFIHWEKLIFFTAFGPVLVGAIHSINGFLRISDLAEDHAKMVVRLGYLLSTLNKAILNNDSDEILHVAHVAYEVLCNRDVQWEEMAKRFGIKLA